MSADMVTLLINGMVYGGWKEIEIERGIDRAVSSFNVAVSERWAGQAQPWKIQAFDAVQVFVGPDLMLTGFVESYGPQFDARTHAVRITGHSKTKDLVDCNLDIPSGQFNGFSVAAIARAVCALFNIGVVVQTTMADQVLANTNLNRNETAFSFLERLGRLAGVLLCDDVKGNLVLTTAGGANASSTLVQGQNIKAGSAMYNVAKRHSHYIVKGQAAIGYGTTVNLNLKGLGQVAGSVPPVYGPTLPVPTGTVQTQMRAVALDTSVPRYRPKVVLAESQLTLAQMQQRANWMKQYAYGQSVKAPITVQGFRQADGTLWQTNQLVSTTSLWLGLDADLLVARLRFKLDEKTEGHVTILEVGPVEGYIPDPAEVKLHKTKGGGKGKGKGGLNLAGLGHV